VTADVVELLQQLIRNRCVNNHETRNAETIASFLDGSGLGCEFYEKVPGRASLVTRIEGSDPTAPSLLLMGHTDVVPVNESRWKHDPFGGELIDGYVWGRGALDMLNLTAAMAVAMRHAAVNGVRPRGDVIYLAVADEEAGGVEGAEFLVEHHRDAVMADYVITENGGFPLTSTTGPKLPVIIGEKGYARVTLDVRGVAGHSSMPHGADNAIVTAARIVQRIADHLDEPQLQDSWRRFVRSMAYDSDLESALLDPARFDEVVDRLPDGIGPRAHACAHMTLVPTIINGGVKDNVIPDSVQVIVNVRTLVDHDEQAIRSVIESAVGDLIARVAITVDVQAGATESPVDTPLWDILQQSSASLIEGAACVPMMTAGGTDASAFRRAGAVAYGFGLYSEKLPMSTFVKLFHGDDERVDVDSLGLSTSLFSDVLFRW
jgi:acetylornithine deacetylase/succinyl-diaminopimelate desuccinylase-like protein